MRFVYTKTAAENMLRWNVKSETVEHIIQNGRVVERTASETRSCGIHAERLVTVRHTQVNEEETIIINIQVTTSERAIREHQARRSCE
jgi:hypothetical protein